MNAHFVEIASRTKMKRSGIKIHCMSVVTRGLVQLCLAMTGPSTSPQVDLARQMLVATVGTNLFAQAVVLLATYVTLRIRTGRSESDIYRTCTNSESATAQRSFTARITSGSILNTVMLVPVVNGPTCLKTPACWKRSHLNQYDEQWPFAMLARKPPSGLARLHRGTSQAMACGTGQLEDEPRQESAS